MRQRILAAIVLISFGIYSTWVSVKEGYVGFFTLPFTHRIWTQEFLDLVIALTLVSSWMASDGRRRGATVWPYLLLTPLLGSLAPLAYLAFRRERAVGA